MNVGSNVYINQDGQAPIKGLLVGVTGDIGLVATDKGFFERPLTELGEVTTAVEAALDAAVVWLANVKAATESAERAIQARLEALYAEMAGLVEMRDTGKKRVEALDLTVRTLAIRAYEETGSKRPHPNVSVARTDRVVCTNTPAAIKWAIDTNHMDSLQLATGFNAQVKAGNVPRDIAHVESMPTPRIDKDLSALLVRALPVEPPAPVEPSAPVEPPAPVDFE